MWGDEKERCAWFLLGRRDVLDLTQLWTGMCRTSLGLAWVERGGALAWDLVRPVCLHSYGVNRCHRGLWELSQWPACLHSGAG